MKPADRSMLGACVHDLRMGWRSLALTDLAYKVLGFVILTPLVGLLLRFFLSLSGRSVLADQDILTFFLGPVGVIALVVVGAVWIGIVALELAALMLIAYGTSSDQRVRVGSALYFAWKHTWPVLQVTARVVGLLIVGAAPFLAVGGGIFLVALTEFDINYYLTEKPPVFWIAGSLILCTLIGMVVVLARMIVRWAFALPLLLFEEVPPRDALRTSRDRTAGHRMTILRWITGWFLATSLISIVGTGAVGLVGQLIVPAAGRSIALVAAAVGLVLLLMGVMNVVLTLINATTFSVLLVNLYRTLGGRGADRKPEVATSESIRARHALLRSGWLLPGIVVVAVIVSGVVGTVAVRSFEVEDHTEIIAHRGASAAAPENSLAAVEQAIADGADWVEVDVQESADGVVMVVHDSDLKKAAGSDLKIWQATAEQLQAVDIGAPRDPQFAGERVPTLEQVLKACKGRVGLNIELKYYGHDQQLEQRVAELVEQYDMQSEIVIMSLEYRAVEKMRALRPTWRIGLLTAVAVGDLTKLNADFLAVNLGLAKRAFIRSAHRSQKDVYVWTVNDPLTMSSMMGRGVDGVITDVPAVARAVREERAAMSPVERLLVELAVLFGVEPQRSQAIEEF